MQSLEIRKAQKSDTATIAEFNCAMAKETESLDLNKEIVKQGVEGLINNPNFGHYWLAQAKEKIIGQLMITYEWSDWRNGVIWWIQSVYVVPEYRGKKVYSRLYQHIYNYCKDKEGICGIRLYVEHNNTKALAIYKHLGMEKTPYEMLHVDFVYGSK